MGIENIWKSYSEMQGWVEVGLFPLYDVEGKTSIWVIAYQRYEEEYLVPNKSSHTLADLSLDFLLQRFPEAYGIRQSVKSMVICFVDDKTRKAMMWVAGVPQLINTYATVLTIIIGCQNHIHGY